jgi:CTP:phosphocholine cytidylyltransferase-like protein
MIKEASYECAWIFKGMPFESEDIKKDFFSFIYLITDNKNNKRYIGQKMFRSHKIVTKQGKKSKVKIESDWKNYFSSSETIKQLIKDDGTGDITREIIYICFSKGQANYLETKLQIELGCLENNDIWYNGIVNCKVHHSHVKMDKLQDTDVDLLSRLYAQFRPTLL